MIIQGTTPTHKVTLPFDAKIVKCARFVYSQNGEAKVVKSTEDITMDGATLSVRLTQEDTFSLSPAMRVQLIVRILTAAGDALASDPINMTVRGCCDCEVLA